MHRPAIVIVAAAALPLACLTAADGQTARNPPGTGTLGGPTRNPTGDSARPASAASDSRAPALPEQTKPPQGSDQLSTNAPGINDRTAPGHTIGVGPNTPGSGGAVTGAGGPSVLNPSGANGGAGPAPLGGSGPNGATGGNGSKAAPMQANGVRKVD